MIFFQPLEVFHNHIARLPMICHKQAFWYAVYTRPRHEKKVHSQLQYQKIESFLPLQTTIRQWSDRKKKITEPLFNCYVFVRITCKEYYPILNLDGVVRFVTFEGKAVEIPEKQIQLIRNLLGENIEVSDNLANIPIGSPAKIIAGPLIGLTGILSENAGKKLVVFQIDGIGRLIYVKLPSHFLAMA